MQCLQYWHGTKTVKYIISSKTNDILQEHFMDNHVLILKYTYH